MEGTRVMLFCLCLFTILMISSATDTINANQAVMDGETIVSAGGEFEMGFFSPGGGSHYRYFGIWYRKISNGRVIWVANRDAPVNTTLGVIRVSSWGIMVGTKDSTNNVIWSSNYSRSVRNPVAQLLDNGNLVLRDESEGDNYVWQSFDYAVDNLLPGMKLGYDFVSGIDRYFVAWKTDNAPSSGDYIYRMDRNGFPQLILWENSVVRFRTGPWVGSKFSGSPVLDHNQIYRPGFVMTQTEVYYAFNLVNGSGSAITRITLTPEGDLIRLVWNREKQEWTRYLTLQANDCDSYGMCGMDGVCNVNKSPRCECMKGFRPRSPGEWAEANWSKGCLRNVQVECGNGDGFLKYSGVKLPDTRWSWYNTSMSLFECEAKCRKDCNCTAYSNMDIRNGGSGCLLWFGGLNDIRGYSEDGEDLYVRMAASELERTKDSRGKKLTWIIIIPVFITLAVILAILGLYLLHVFRKRRLRRAETVQLNSTRDASNRNEGQDLDLPLLDFKQIAKATDNFSLNNKLGEGGFGTVYKGMLEEGQEVAVKRLSKDSRQGVDEFMNEVSCIAKLQHRNLVRLLKCCIDKGERMLIYEYMPNKSLDSFIFDKEKCRAFDWPKRYNIINGTARGLLYLHQDSRLRIIHRDLKASNILLDSEMNPKISDFGLARIFGGSETQESTTRIVGTYGYMPPEYAIDGLFSIKSDVYSFGVLILEIISGKKNRGFRHPDHNLNLVGHAWRSYNEGKLLDIADEVILDSSNEHEVFRVIEIGLQCVQEFPEDRPNMASAVLMLTSKDALPNPKRPGFYSERRESMEMNSTSRNPASSSPSNSYSVSLSWPR
ncbi:Receptor-like serine/threonine-protein kinase [Heracleum sosnowskyi]|uniref:Receptor-like serine/threonine-protein kinase n=1 Tax=Heracleum sosnowskyi TaxID=360622 RepID=A0AAD8H4G8_9APIA|nr:Receptor-like serine/threonine-protein kinase [Heracleum sosnowskyi]